MNMNVLIQISHVAHDGVLVSGGGIHSFLAGTNMALVLLLTN